MDLTLAVTILAIVLNGVLAGASLDQSIKQLPARRKIGAVAYSAYSRAADLGNGIVWYAALGIGAAVVTVGVAILVAVAPSAAVRSTPVYCAAVLSVLHTAVTTQAARANFSQRRLNQEGDLARVFDTFAQWQNVRATLQLLTLLSLAVALAR